MILKSPVKEVNDSVLTLTVCTVKGNGTLTIGDEDLEVLWAYFHCRPMPYNKDYLLY